MKRIFVICSVMLLLAVSALGQIPDSLKNWKASLILDITTTQSAYSDSWVGGEAGALNWVANLNGSAERQLKTWFNLRSTLKLSFGQTMIQDDSTKEWSKPKKSTDLIDFDNLGRFTVQAFVDPYASFRLESQFYTQLSSVDKAYFSPIRFTEAAGIAKRFYERPKDDHVTSRLGFGFRQLLKKTLVGGVITDSTLTDGGLESVTDAKLQLASNVGYVGKLTLFKALFFSQKDKVKGTPFEDDWKAVDANWETQINASLTKVLTVSFYTQVLYDKEISRKGRFKETLALGLTFKLR